MISLHRNAGEVLVIFCRPPSPFVSCEILVTLDSLSCPLECTLAKQSLFEFIAQLADYMDWRQKSRGHENVRCETISEKIDTLPCLHSTLSSTFSSVPWHSSYPCTHARTRAHVHTRTCVRHAHIQTYPSIHPPTQTPSPPLPPPPHTHTHALTLAIQYCRVPKNGLPKNGQAGISPKNKNDPGWKNELRTVHHTQRAFAVKTTSSAALLGLRTPPLRRFETFQPHSMPSMRRHIPFARYQLTYVTRRLIVK